MTTDECLNTLRKIRSTMFTIRVSDVFRNQDGELRNKFLDARIQIMHIIDRLEISQLQSISDSLAQNEQEFTDATADLKQELDKLDNAIKIINTISHVISVVTKIAGVLL